MKLPIIHLDFPTRHLLCATMLRFQEHYESPKFAGKIFDLEEYMDWYAEERGEFSYLSDWSGFNIPSQILAPFRTGEFDPLSRKEKALLAELNGECAPFYLVATYGADRVTLAHEIVHGAFWFSSSYREDVSRILSAHDTAEMRRILGGLGYTDAVMDDEINAFILTGLQRDMEEVVYPKLKDDLRHIWIGCFGEDSDPTTEEWLTTLIGSIRSRTFDPRG